MSDGTPRVPRRGRGTRVRSSAERRKAKQPLGATLVEIFEREELEAEAEAKRKADALPLASPHDLLDEAVFDAKRRRAKARREDKPAEFPTPTRPGPLSSTFYFDGYADLRDWLHRVYSVGFGHGSKLVLALGTKNEHKPHGLSDNVATADKMLQTLEADGWIVRQKYDPTDEQIFFGVGGRPPGKRATGGYGHAIEHGWTVNEESVELRTALKLSPKRKADTRKGRGVAVLFPDPPPTSDDDLADEETIKLPMTLPARKNTFVPHDFDAPFVERRGPMQAQGTLELRRVNGGLTLDRSGFVLSKDTSHGLCLACLFTLAPEQITRRKVFARTGYLRSVYAGPLARPITCAVCSRVFDGELDD